MDDSKPGSVIDINMDRMIDPLRNLKFSGKNVLIGLIVILALFFVFGSLYQVQPEEVGVVLRFGRYVRTTDPGLRKFPSRKSYARCRFSAS